MKGFRPSFYPENPRLHSIELLAWASTRASFTMKEIHLHFAATLSKYGDPIHEISERLRKMAKSGYIYHATEGVVKALLQQGVLKRDQAVHLMERLQGIVESRELGRKPRLYAVSQTGIRYVHDRKADLAKISKKKS